MKIIERKRPEDNIKTTTKRERERERESEQESELYTFSITYLISSHTRGGCNGLIDSIIGPTISSQAQTKCF